VTNEELVKAWESGMTGTEIAKKYGRTMSVVYARLRSLREKGLNLRPTGRILPSLPALAKLCRPVENKRTAMNLTATENKNLTATETATVQRSNLPESIRAKINAAYLAKV
jgi:transposase